MMSGLFVISGQPLVHVSYTQFLNSICNLFFIFNSSTNIRPVAGNKADGRSVEMSNLTVKNPTDIELERAAEVAAIAFPNLSLEHWQESFHTVDEMFGRQFILVVETDGKIVSSMLCTPGPIYVQNQLISHSAAGGVGTLPEYRKIGCASVMMTECARILRREGIIASSLWPFSYPYYRKFGWEVGAEMRAYSSTSKAFLELGDINNARGADSVDYIQITEIYDQIAARYNCLTERSDEWWTRILKIGDCLKWTSEPGRGTIVHVSDDEVDGYAVYDIVQNEEKLKIDVKEIFYNEPAHRRDMLALLSTIDPEAELTFYAPAEDTFLQELPDPRKVQASMVPSFQFRIFDPIAALTLLKTHDCVSGRVSFSISDPVFEEGFEFGIEVDGGIIGECDFDSNQALSMDIQTFARLYSGYSDLLSASHMGKIEIPIKARESSVRIAKEIFGNKQPYRTWLEPG